MDEPPSKNKYTEMMTLPSRNWIISDPDNRVGEKVRLQQTIIELRDCGFRIKERRINDDLISPREKKNSWPLRLHENNFYQSVLGRIG